MASNRRPRRLNSHQCERRTFRPAMLRCRAKPSSVLDLDPERAGDNRRRSRKHRKEKKEKKERRDKVKNKKNKKDKKDKKDGKERSGETRGAPAERAPAGAQGGPVARLWRPWGSRPIGALLKPAVLPPPPPSPPGGLKGISLEHFCALAKVGQSELAKKLEHLLTDYDLGVAKMTPSKSN